MDIEELLGQVTLFRSLKKKQLETLARFCGTRTYEPGQVIVKQDDTGLGLYIIASGHADVYKEENGGRSATMTRYGPGDFFGEMSLLDDFPRSATVVALDWVECLILAKWNFLAELERHPEMALPLLPILSQRIRAAEERLHA